MQDLEFYSNPMAGNSKFEMTDMKKKKEGSEADES